MQVIRYGYLGIRINYYDLSKSKKMRFGWCSFKNMLLSFHKPKRLEIRNSIKSKSMTLKYPIDTKTKAQVIKTCHS